MILDEICLRHLLGWSKIPKQWIDSEDKEHEYCSGCIPDDKNKYCKHYQPVAYWRVEIES